MMGVSAQSGRAEVTWLCPVAPLDNWAEDEAVSREPLPLISALQTEMGMPRFLGYLAPLEGCGGRPESCLSPWGTHL